MVTVSRQVRKRAFDPRICDGVDASDIIAREKSRRARLENENAKIVYLKDVERVLSSLRQKLTPPKRVLDSLSKKEEKEIQVSSEMINAFLSNIIRMKKVSEALVIDFSEPVVDLGCLAGKSKMPAGKNR